MPQGKRTARNLLYVKFKSGKAFGQFCVGLRELDLAFGMIGHKVVSLTDRDFRKAARLPVLNRFWFRVMDRNALQEYLKSARPRDRQRMGELGFDTLSRVT